MRIAIPLGGGMCYTNSSFGIKLHITEQNSHYLRRKKEMLHKKALWRGLLFVFAIVLSISIIASLLLESLRANLDNMTGSRSELIVSEDDGTLWSAFTPPDDVLNADGTGNSQKLIKKLIQFGRDQAVGGAVLLKNNNNALPLASGSSVTMLGIRSHVPILGAGMGMPIRGAVITMEDALGDTKTHFNETSRGVGYTSNTYSTDGGSARVSFAIPPLPWYSKPRRYIGRRSRISSR